MTRSLLIIVVAIGLAWGPAGGVARAGWVTLSNDTSQTVVVQEMVTVNGQVRKCKPFKLAPGETVREFHPAGGTKKLTILEPGLLGRQLFNGDVTWKDDTTFSIHREADKFKLTDAATLNAKAKPVSRETKPAPEKKPR
ncbi:MAG: hypothetical protein KF873_17070 [Gemmataceae bacterium]|nr:hypothetical protein [Gemmataceae bacterium]